MSVRIESVTPRSPAAKAGIKAGETLVSINGNKINDALDYGFYTYDRELSLELDTRTVVVRKKDDYDEIGLNFETYLMDKKQTCRNKCIFCFIDQLPKGMRKTLYFKDDDSRLSFLQGNYITLTNMNDEDIERIIKMKLNVNISVHTTNPELRVKMLNNKNAGRVLDYIPKMAENDITMNCQIVLCKGINDGEELRRTLNDLTALYPAVQSIAVVPFGASAYRDGLAEIPLHDKESALSAVRIIEEYGDKLEEKYGDRVVYPADELFLTAELPIPDRDYYGAFDQYENGVGMWAYLRDGYLECLEEVEDDGSVIEKSIATGLLAAPLLNELAEATMKLFSTVKLRVFPVKNNFFGETITVAGLVTGKDLINQLLPYKSELGTALVIPKTMLKADEPIFLDNVTLSEVEDALCVEVIPVGDEPEDLIEALLG
ncbi:MAG: DUF512 domain-containing protein [Ruminiclostridium sp.]|nr:DUF512 domain-containing protein [Ruminiclostridium sp.]